MPSPQVQITNISHAPGERVTGRTIVLGDEVYQVTCDKRVPHHYVRAALMLLVVVLPNLVFPSDLTRPVLLGSALALITLIFAWSTDDRDAYRLRFILHLKMPRGSNPPGKACNTQDSEES